MSLADATPLTTTTAENVPASAAEGEEKRGIVINKTNTDTISGNDEQVVTIAPQFEKENSTPEVLRTDSMVPTEPDTGNESEAEKNTVVTDATNDTTEIADAATATTADEVEAIEEANPTEDAATAGEVEAIEETKHTEAAAAAAADAATVANAEPSSSEPMTTVEDPMANKYKEEEENEVTEPLSAASAGDKRVAEAEPEVPENTMPPKKAKGTESA
eukprot:UC1_evm2s1716